MTTTTDKVVTREIARTLSTHGGRLHSTAIVEAVHTRSRLRVTINADGYINQSYARVEFWNGTQWAFVHSEPGEAVDHLKTMAVRISTRTETEANLNAGIAEVEARLITIAMKTIG